MYFSIVIPVYRVEQDLPACLDSILAQTTAASWEVILVDDGSPDRSGAICDAYAARDSRFRVIHQENRGVSCSRNAGIEVAKGEYVLFLDSDDLWLPDLLSRVTSLTGTGVDMIQFSAQVLWERRLGQVLEPQLPPKENGEKGEVYLLRCLQTGVLPVYGSYYYAYRRAFLVEHGLRFPPELSINEDLDFVMNCLYAAEEVRSLRYVGYLYRQREDSAVHTPTPKKQMMRLVTPAKWYRRYPCSAFANLFTYSCIPIAAVGTREEAAELCAFFRENRDIAAAASEPKLRMARYAFALFGPYHGSRLLNGLIRLRHGRNP